MLKKIKLGFYLGIGFILANLLANGAYVVAYAVAIKFLTN